MWAKATLNIYSISSHLSDGHARYDRQGAHAITLSQPLYTGVCVCVCMRWGEMNSSLFLNLLVSSFHRHA